MFTNDVCGRGKGYFVQAFWTLFYKKEGGGGKKYRKYENVISVGPRTLQKLDVAATLRKGEKKCMHSLCVLD